jgi:hypothetical protein
MKSVSGFSLEETSPDYTGAPAPNHIPMIIHIAPSKMHTAPTNIAGLPRRRFEGVRGRPRREKPLAPRARVEIPRTMTNKSIIHPMRMNV